MIDAERQALRTPGSHSLATAGQRERSAEGGSLTSLRTAKALRLSIPPAVLAQADRLIE